MSKPVAIYTRVSSDEQAISGLGLEAQAYACSRYADLALNGTRRHKFEEHASAASISTRPIFSSLLTRASEFSALVVLRLDRLARNTRELLSIISMLSDAGCKLHSVTEHLDTDSPAGRVMTTILAAFAEYERDLISTRTRDAMAIAKRNGRHCGRPPFGYKSKPFGPDPLTYPLLRKALALKGKGLSSYQIAQQTGLPHSTVRCLGRSVLHAQVSSP